MPHTHLLVEGINIYPNVLDTDQLSVIRGSSFILKQAIDHISASFKDKFEPITTGASSGLFLVNEGINIDKLVTGITIQLEISPYCYFCFAIEYCQADDLLTAKEQLYAQLRFHQMGAITMVPDCFDKTGSRKAHPCELEGRRVAAPKERTVQGATRKLALSVCERLDFGRKQRQGFYFKEGNVGDIEALREYRFTDDLEALTEDERYSKLNKKMAVIYLDGNKFSSIQKSILEAAQDQVAAQKRFDHDIKDKRASFLKATLLEMIKSDASRFPDATARNSDDENIIRLETLLWGGDEMLFVLPAWIGFELMQSFFQASAEWEAGGERLTHAAGIVFCSAKTPIRIIRDIAQSLADTIKDRLGDERKVNSWDYMVLESIDYPVSKEIGAFNHARYGYELATSRPCHFSPAPNWDKSKLNLHQLITDGLLSRRQLYRIVDAVIQQNEPATVEWTVISGREDLPETATAQDIAERRMLQLLDEAKRNQLNEILPVLASDLFSIEIENGKKRAWLWLNLIELWDYLVPSREDD